MKDRHTDNNVLIQLSNTTKRTLEKEAVRTGKSIQAVMRKILNDSAKDLAVNEHQFKH